jgi:SSS family transporter
MDLLVPQDYLAILIYFVLMAGIGLFFKWYVKDVKAFTKGSGAIPWVAAGISNFMAMFSTFVFVAYAGIAYEYGMVSVTVFTSTVPACIVAALVFARRWRRAGVSTPIEYLERRFNSSVRQTIGWVGILLRILDNMVRLYAIGIFLTAVTPLSLEWCLVISSFIVITFTLFGGLWAVSIMSTVQFVILLFTSGILLWLSLSEVGGLGVLVEKVPDHFNFFNGPKGGFLWLSVYYLMIIIKYNEHWIFIQRFYSVKDEKTAEKVGWLSAALFAVIPGVFMLPPIVSYVLFPDLPDKEMAYVAISSALLPAGVMGVMIASMFAATMSSLNAEYNVIASVLSKDVYQRLIRHDASDTHLLFVAKASTVLVGLLVLLGGLFIKDFGGAFEANKLFTGIFAIPIGIPLVLGIISPRPTTRGALLTVFIGAVAGIVLNSFPDVVSWQMATLLETAICLLVFYGSAWFPSRNSAYLSRVRELFIQLKTKITDIPAIDEKFQRALTVLYIASLVASGLLFVGMGVQHIEVLSGKLTVASGAVCGLLAGAIFFYQRSDLKKRIR